MKKEIKKEWEKINELEDKIDLINNLNSLNPYFSIDWIEENILGTENKSKKRKDKIKKVLKDE